MVSARKSGETHGLAEGAIKPFLPTKRRHANLLLIASSFSQWTTWESNPETADFESARYASSRQSSRSRKPGFPARWSVATLTLRPLVTIKYLMSENLRHGGRWRSRTPTRRGIPWHSTPVASQPSGTFQDTDGTSSWDGLPKALRSNQRSRQCRGGSRNRTSIALYRYGGKSVRPKARLGVLLQVMA